MQGPLLFISADILKNGLAPVFWDGLQMPGQHSCLASERTINSLLRNRDCCSLWTQRVAVEGSDACGNKLKSSLVFMCK